jgi:hypothetical protein
VSFSSYGGFVSSSDDFYVLDTGLVVTETTLNMLDETAYATVDPSTQVVTWLRTLVGG